MEEEIPLYMKSIIEELSETRINLTLTKLDSSFLKGQLESAEETIVKLNFLLSLNQQKIKIIKKKFFVDAAGLCGYSINDHIRVYPLIDGVKIGKNYIFNEPYTGKLIFNVDEEILPFTMIFFIAES